MNNRFKHRILFTLALQLLLPFHCFAQFPETEKRIYIVDVTKSMEGEGSVKTENIFSAVKDSLISAINSIEDPTTEITVIPFGDVVFQTINGTLEKKDSLIKQILNIRTQAWKTNIADAWESGLKHLDTNKVNYLFLLTDGIHNYGPKVDVLYERLKEWPAVSAGKHFFSFYVMLTKNAQDDIIEKIAKENDNMWPIKSMNINAVFLHSPLSVNVNVNEKLSGEYGFFIHSNNSKVPLHNIGLSVLMNKNPYYSISEAGFHKDVEDIKDTMSYKRSRRKEYFSFKLTELKQRSEIPVEFNATLYLSHTGNKDSLYFVFLTPEKIKLHISNLGVREVSISDRNTKKLLTTTDNLGVIEFQEPFQGIFKWARPILEPSLKWIPYKWYRPDTAYIERWLDASFNEDATRSFSSLKLEMVPEIDEYSKYLVANFSPGTDDGFEIYASGEMKGICFRAKVLPELDDTVFCGTYDVSSYDLDRVNGKDIQSDTTLCRWMLSYRKQCAWELWILWLLSLAAILYGLYHLLKGLAIALAKFGVALPVSSVPSSIQSTQNEVSENDDRRKKERSNKKRKKCPCHPQIGIFCEILKNKEASISDKCIVLEKYHDYWCSLSNEKQNKVYNMMCPEFKPLYEKYWAIPGPVPTSEHGKWTGERGNSLFDYDNDYCPVLDDDRNGLTWGELVKAYQEDFNLKGDGSVRYECNRIDLSDYIVESVSFDIEDLNEILKNKDTESISRISQSKACELFSVKMSDVFKAKGYSTFYEYKDGMMNEKFVRQTPLVIHADYDGRTFHLVPKFLHDNWPHYGGISLIDFVVNHFPFPSTGNSETDTKSDN